MRNTVIMCAVLAGAAVAGTIAQDTSMSFFITSAGPRNGANLGGLTGVDQHCQKLASAAGAGGRTWRAYLSGSASGNEPAVHARYRIGTGPWHNAKGMLIAQNLNDLHGDNTLTKETAPNKARS